jgi:hypothetical protein
VKNELMPDLTVNFAPKDPEPQLWVFLERTSLAISGAPLIRTSAAA